MNGRSTDLLVFDTCVIIPALKDKSLVDLLDKFAASDRFISVITRIELLSFHSLTDEETCLINLFFDSVTVVPLNNDVEEKAIEFRRLTKHKTPDAIIAATSIVLNAVLFTRDSRLLGQNFPGLETLRL
ncbi:MAG: type II toxin-antitoxin system VapC family toxin [Spirochaetales bacterium]|jgi:predicted nucleic acid-binding protein|nr:type II toxin-antitoxin system VapC family toxin [Spirochaetales bacterium]